MEIMEIVKAVILGVIQGITEWLPISSTGHMILADEWIQLDMTAQFKDMFFVVIQLGSILAVVVLYFHKLNPFSLKKTRTERQETFSLWFKVLVAILPTGIAGILLDDWIHERFYNPLVVSLALVIYGVLFIIMENRAHKSPIDSFQKLSYKTALCIGIFQTLALIPGTSRSGSTILGAVLLGASRYIAAEFSFFLAIPVMLGASALKLLKFGFAYTATEWGVLLVGTAVSFVVSLFAIKFLIGYIKKHDFKAFGYYRIVLGVIVLLYFTFISQ